VTFDRLTDVFHAGLAAHDRSVLTSSTEDVSRLQTKYQNSIGFVSGRRRGSFPLCRLRSAGPRAVSKPGLRASDIAQPGETQQGDNIYKRAAESFDLFLAPELKGIINKLPRIASVSGVGFSIMNEISSASAAGSSEAVEFFFPLVALDRFANAEITNQDLINQGVVLINGVRISLDLQRVE
jgi:hypothetical protein